MKLKKILYQFFLFFIIVFLSIYFKRNRIYIESNNKINEYEKNIDFSKYKTNIKAIALYLPQFHENKENNEFWGKGFTEWTNVKKAKPLFPGHHQPRIPGDEYGYLGYYDLKNVKAIENQVKLAKSHGIYGFGIYYYWFSGKTILKKPINKFIQHSYIEFHFLLIWANENWTKRWNGGDNEILLKQEYKPKDPENFIKDIKKYIKDKRYIRINDKPVIGLYEPNKIPNLKTTISIWREKSRNIGIGEIFILICINRNKTLDFQKLNLFDAAYEFPPRNSFKNNRVSMKKTLIYSELLYISNHLNETNTNFQKFPFFRGSMVEWDNSPRIKNFELFENYSPEQFYIFNKIIINWTTQHYNKDLQFIFINAWNEWGEGSYLEPDDKYGYASINSLSKAIFNISFVDIHIPIVDYKIAVLLYLKNEYSIEEIINKINNIPYIYDLFIYINNKKNKDYDYLKKFIILKSNANFLKLDFFFNKKDNLLTFLYNFKDKAKNYKYICNINSNHYEDIDYYFDEWKNYLHNNLLGNTKIISEIISEFEKIKELGLIFPEIYYKSMIRYHGYINDFDLLYLNSILRKINSEVYLFQNFVDFPEGNMFWAKVSAIHQIFNLYSNIIFTQKYILMLENKLDKIWVFLAKINGFSYKKIFKHL